MQWQQRFIVIIGFSLFFWLLAFGQGLAADKTVSDTIGPQRTNWQDTLAIDKFDPADGTLRSVEITLIGTIDGVARYESTDAQATLVTLHLAANIQLQRPDNGQLIQASPLFQKQDSAAAFDGTVDYAGASGGSFPELTATTSQRIVLSAPADLALFSGTGQVLLPVQATGASRASGSGNLITEFIVNAQASVTVKYNFDPANTPKIRLKKTVYAGHNQGAGCPGVDRLAGKVGDPITYCFEIKNTGTTALTNITLVDADLGIDLRQMTLLKGNPTAPLAPGARLVYFYQTTLQRALVNTAMAEGKPDNGQPNVKDDDSAEVVIAIDGVITVCKEDSNGNRLAGWQIKLSGPEKQSAVTGADGCVTFTVALTGDYQISEVQQPGWVQMQPANGGHYKVAVKGDGRFGPYLFVNARQATIHACKVDDATGNPLANWELNLHGPEMQSLLTAADGCVAFQVTQSGDYTINETQQPGWTQVAPTVPDFFTIPGVSAGGVYGANREYTFRNRQEKQPDPITQLTVIKQVENGFGGAATPADFTILVSGNQPSLTSFPGSVAGVTVSLNAGAYSVSEEPVRGYVGEFSVECSGVINPGEHKICTIINRQSEDHRPARITLVKYVINDDDGTAQPEDFDLFIGDTPVKSGQTLTVTPGVSYMISESLRTDYEFISLTGTKGCPNQLGGTVTAQPGDEIICVITNDDTLVDVGALMQIGDFAWLDHNKNGIQDDGAQSGRGGVTVKLYYADGTYTGRSTITDLQGYYLFGELEEGAYLIEFSLPEKLSFTETNKRVSGNESQDSDADSATGRTGVITLLPGKNNMDIDVGFIPAPTDLPPSGEPTQLRPVVYLSVVMR